ncbi:MAG: VWA domain-containing protein, partial [Phycisphaerales bacterium JB059]
MTFLAPVAGLVGLGLGLPALLTFYLLRLRRRPVRVSSTMFWEQATQDLQVNVPLRWLRPSWLLLLHLLILLLLVGALGRPAIESDAPARSRVFVVMDRTASMSAADMEGNRTRFEAGVERARALARELLSGLDAPSVSLISLAREARVVTPPTRVRGEIELALDALTPTDQPGRLEPALRLIESMLERETAEGEEGAPALGILISDGGCAGDGALSL